MLIEYRGDKMNLYFVQLALFCIHALVGLSNGGAQYPFKDGPSIVNVLDYGAIGNGVDDDTPAFLKAWNDACGKANITGVPTMLIPQGRKLSVSPVTLSGPCQSSAIHFRVEGAIVAPSNREGWNNCNKNSWIVFSQIFNLFLDGPGLFDGQGRSWWESYLAIEDENQDNGACNSPQALSFLGVVGLRVEGISLLNSPSAHISIENCNDAIISKVQIQAPANSPNTDGIDIRDSSHVQIIDSAIATGTDCISIGTQSLWINVTGVNCGPGHRISVGALGKYGGHAQVEQVHVQHCSFTNAMFAARIKTWQGGSGYARNIMFEDIPVVNVSYPIVIDQFYCNGLHYGCPTKPSAVAVSDVTFRGIQGTTSTGGAISLNCSSTVACTGITMEKIDVTSTYPAARAAFAACNNVKGTQLSVSPQVPCLND